MPSEINTLLVGGYEYAYGGQSMHREMHGTELVCAALWGRPCGHVGCVSVDTVPVKH